MRNSLKHALIIVMGEADIANSHLLTALSKEFKEVDIQIVRDIDEIDRELKELPDVYPGGSKYNIEVPEVITKYIDNQDFNLIPGYNNQPNQERLILELLVELELTYVFLNHIILLEIHNYGILKEYILTI